MNLKAVVMDDILGDLRLMRDRLLEWRSDVEVVAECDTIDKAARALMVHRPDVLFADIDMEGDETGLSFIRKIKDTAPGTQYVMVTSHRKHEFWEEHVRMHLTDFLLKPFMPEELDRAVEEVWTRLTRRIYPRPETKPGDRGRELVLRDSTREFKVYEDEIFYANAAEHYLDIHFTNGDKRTCNCKISEFDSMVSPSRFVDAGRSHRLHRRYIQEIDRKARTVRLRNEQGQSVIIADAKSPVLEAALDVLRALRQTLKLS